jgi:hypothetical protein
VVLVPYRRPQRGRGYDRDVREATLAGLAARAAELASGPGAIDVPPRPGAQAGIIAI